MPALRLLFLFCWLSVFEWRTVCFYCGMTAHFARKYRRSACFIANKSRIICIYGDCSLLRALCACLACVVRVLRAWFSCCVRACLLLPACVLACGVCAGLRPGVCACVPASVCKRQPEINQGEPEKRRRPK